MLCLGDALVLLAIEGLLNPEGFSQMRCSLLGSMLVEVEPAQVELGQRYVVPEREAFNIMFSKVL